MFAAIINVTAGAGVAMAQSVLVKDGPPGMPVEVILNSAAIGSATVDQNGDATIPVNLQAHGGKTETDAHVYVDVCEKMRRVLIIERGQQPPAPEAGCDRKDVLGLFLVRRVSTIVLNLGGVNPTVLLIQGQYRPGAPSRSWGLSPKGLVLGGGAGLSRIGDAGVIFCGDVSTCESDSSGIGYTASAAFWVTRFAAAEVAYIRPSTVSAEGTGGETLRFNSTLEANVLTIGGKGGVPAGPVRIYGHGGINRHQAKSLTNQTLNGVTNLLELRTEGWGWQFGGGGEVWIMPRFALFGEFTRLRLKGDARGGGEGSLDDSLMTIFGGARFKIF